MTGLTAIRTLAIVNNNRLIMLGAVLTLSACATTPDIAAPGTPIRREFGYVCDATFACPSELRCYRRYPKSEGRCVTTRYYREHDRGCHIDADCEIHEVCGAASYPKAGLCGERWEAGTVRGRSSR